jgi:PIN domain nuclease of toxin-antitoxin system
MIYLDTHVVVWLYGGLTDELSPVAVSAIEADELLMSPMVRLELQYLFETGRILAKPDAILSALATELGLATCALAFPAVIQKALSLNWTRDPFDRIIVAQAIAGKRALLTRDQTIHEHFDGAVW